MHDEDLAMDKKKPYTLLVIDDLADNIALITHILKDTYDIRIATTPALGLEIAQRDMSIDLILLDIVMPMMDGYEVCRRLKENMSTQDIPVIFLTVLDETVNIEQGFLVGGVDYVTKPFDVSVLKARVKTHCELFRQKKELKHFNMTLEKLVEERTQALEQSQLHVERLARQATLGNVVAMLAHQWRQPMSVISMAVNNVLLDIALEKIEVNDLKNQMQTISTQTLYLSDTIEHFRNFFKPNKDKQTINMVSFCDSLQSLLYASLQYHGIAFKQEIPEDLWIQTYKNELLQVLVNLINNAKDAILFHNTHSPCITLRVYTKLDTLFLDVIDNGGGINDSVMETIGKPYVSTKSDKNGTGLGLYISQMILQKHLGGTLTWFNYEEGALFRIALPLSHP